MAWSCREFGRRIRELVFLFSNSLINSVCWMKRSNQFLLITSFVLLAVQSSRAKGITCEILFLNGSTYIKSHDQEFLIEFQKYVRENQNQLRSVVPSVYSRKVDARLLGRRWEEIKKRKRDQWISELDEDVFEILWNKGVIVGPWENEQALWIGRFEKFVQQNVDRLNPFPTTNSVNPEAVRLAYWWEDFQFVYGDRALQLLSPEVRAIIVERKRYVPAVDLDQSVHRISEFSTYVRNHRKEKKVTPSASSTDKDIRSLALWWNYFRKKHGANVLQFFERDVASILRRRNATGRLNFSEKERIEQIEAHLRDHQNDVHLLPRLHADSKQERSLAGWFRAFRIDHPNQWADRLAADVVEILIRRGEYRPNQVKVSVEDKMQFENYIRRHRFDQRVTPSLLSPDEEVRSLALWFAVLKAQNPHNWISVFDRDVIEILR